MNKDKIQTAIQSLKGDKAIIEKEIRYNEDALNMIESNIECLEDLTGEEDFLDDLIEDYKKW